MVSILCRLAVAAAVGVVPQASILSEEVATEGGATPHSVCAEHGEAPPLAASSLVQRAAALLAGRPKDLEVSFTAMLVGGFIGMGFLLGVWMWLYTTPRAEPPAEAEKPPPQEGWWWAAPAGPPAWSVVQPPPSATPPSVTPPQAPVSYAPPPPAPSATPVWAQKMPDTPERPNPERKFDTYEYRHAEQNPAAYLPSEQEGAPTVPAAAESLRAQPVFTPVPAPSSSKRRRQPRGAGDAP